MDRQQIDILVAGGGVAGLTAAAAFGHSGFSVICVDPAPPVTERDADGADLRTTALLQPSRAFLERIGLWPALDAEAAPLQIMRIIDAGGEDGTPRTVKDFDAADISDKPFGWNLPNWLLRRALVARLAQLPNVDFRPGTSLIAMLPRTEQAVCTLSDGAHVTARLVIGADGRGSFVREAAGIDVRTKRYGQKALAFAVTHPIPHENVSTEIHRSGGPFTLVPLPDRDDLPCSAVVWMETGPKAQDLAALDDAAFNSAATERSCGILGPLTAVSGRAVWPIISQIAERLNGPRTALIAEAAHVLPPIGAQGLNMSLADLATLLDLAEARPEALGADEMLDQYHRARHAEIALRVTGIDLLNRTSMMSAQMLKDARARGIEALYAAGPVRKMLMQMGLGAKG